MTHHDPILAAFGYEPTDDWGRAHDALMLAQRARGAEAAYVADKVVEDPPYEHLDIAIEFYRKAVAAEDYARAVWQQVHDERAVA